MAVRKRALVAVAAALVVLLPAACGSDDEDKGAEPIRLAGGGQAGAEADLAIGRPPFALAADIPELDGSADGFRAAPVDGEDVDRLASALGMSISIRPGGSLEPGDDGWTISEGERTLRVSRSGAWAFVADPDGTVSATVVPDGQVPEPDPALVGVAEGVVDAVGAKADPDRSATTGQSDGGVSTLVVPVVEDQPVPNAAISVTVSSDGAVQYASGWFPGAAGEGLPFDRVGVRAAFERYQDGTGLGAYQPILGQPGIPVSGDDPVTSEPGQSEPGSEGSGGGTAGSEGSVAPGSEPSTGTGGGSTPAGSGSEPVGGSTTTGTVPPEVEQPEAVVLTEATSVLLAATDVEGQIWLLPGYELGTEDGPQLALLAIADDAVELPDVGEQPVPATEPAPLESTSASSDSAPATDPSETTIPDGATIVPCTTPEAIEQGATCWVMPAEPSDGDPPSTDTTVPHTTVPDTTTVP